MAKEKDRMTTTDRRSGDERRRLLRTKVAVNVEWQNTLERRTGTISDISELGCFVLSDGDVEDGENILIFFSMDDDMKMEFAARVTNHVFEIGFAATFIGVNTTQKEFLKNFLDRREET